MRNPWRLRFGQIKRQLHSSPWEVKLTSLLLDNQVSALTQTLETLDINGFITRAAVGTNRCCICLAFASEEEAKKLTQHQIHIARALQTRAFTIGPTSDLSTDGLRWEHWRDEEIYESETGNHTDIGNDVIEHLTSLEKQGVHVQVNVGLSEPLRLGDLLIGRAVKKMTEEHTLPLVLGRADDGKEIVWDLAKRPHLLVGGDSGSGKSVCVLSSLVGLTCCKAPDELRLILIDPKMVEFDNLQMGPYLATPVVHCHERAKSVLEWAVRLINDRHTLLGSANVRNIENFHNWLGTISSAEIDQGPPKKMPRIVIVIDEFADLVLTHGYCVKKLLADIARFGCTVGVHLILTTQSMDQFENGIIPAVIAQKICFRMPSKANDQALWQHKGSDLLLGNGDMLLRDYEKGIIRGQCAFVSSGEIKQVCEIINTPLPSGYDQELFRISDSDLQR